MVRAHPTRLWRHAALLAFALLAWLSAALPADARKSHASTTEISAADLPKQGQELLQLIHAGGPFKYSRDGIVFGNREALLPPERRGYYHEYTVSTPGSHNRGARRIICGGEKTAPVACWYTDDHYESFRRIRE